jgi:hypothetical protein
VKLVSDEIIYHCLYGCEDEREIKINKNYVNNEIGLHYFASHTHSIEKVTGSENPLWTKETKCEKVHN